MIPQGAAAAGTFSSKGLIAGAYADGSETHKTTETFLIEEGVRETRR